MIVWGLVFLCFSGFSLFFKSVVHAHKISQNLFRISMSWFDTLTTRIYSRQKLGEEHVAEQDEHARGNDGIGRRLADVHRAALDGIAEESGHTADDEGKELALDDAHPQEPRNKVVLQTKRQIVGRHDVAYVSRAVSTHDAHAAGEDDEERHNGEHAENLWKNKVTSRVDTHDVEGIYLLGDAHRPYLRGDVAAHLACQDETHDA